MTITITVDLTSAFANHNLSFSLEGTAFSGGKIFSTDDQLCPESELKEMLYFLLDKIYDLNSLMKFSKNEANELYISYFQDPDTPEDKTEVWMMALVNFLTLQRDFLVRMGDSSHENTFNENVAQLCSMGFHTFDEWINDYLKTNKFLTEKIESVWLEYVEQWWVRSDDSKRFNSHFLMLDFFVRFQEIISSFREKKDPLYENQKELFPLLAIFAEKQILNIIKKMNEHVLTHLLYQQIQNNFHNLVDRQRVEVFYSQIKSLLKALCFAHFDIQSARKTITGLKLNQFANIRIEDRHQLFKSTQAIAYPLDIQTISDRERGNYLLMSRLNVVEEENFNQNLSFIIENFSYFYELSHRSEILECMKKAYCSKHSLLFVQYMGKRKIVMSLDAPMTNLIFESIANPVEDLLDAYVESEALINNLTDAIDAGLEDGKACFIVKNKVFNFADFNQNKLLFLLLECIEKIKDAEKNKQRVQPCLTNFLMLSFFHLSEERQKLLSEKLTPFANRIMVNDVKDNVIQLDFLQAYFLNVDNHQSKLNIEECRLYLNLFVKFLPELIAFTQNKKEVSSVKLKKKLTENKLIDLVEIITKLLIKHSDKNELMNEAAWQDLQTLNDVFLEWKNGKNNECKEKISSILVKLNNSLKPKESKNIHSGIDALLSDPEFLKSSKPKVKTNANKPAAKSKKNKTIKKKETKVAAKTTPKNQSVLTQDSKKKKDSTTQNKGVVVNKVSAKPGSSPVALFSKPLNSNANISNLDKALVSPKKPAEDQQIELTDSNANPIIPINEEKEKIPSLIALNVETFFNKSPSLPSPKREFCSEPKLVQFYDVCERDRPPITWRKFEYAQDDESPVYYKFQLSVNDKPPMKNQWFEIYFEKVGVDEQNISMGGTIYTDPKNNQQYKAVCTMQGLPEKIPCSYPVSDELTKDIFNHYLKNNLLEQFTIGRSKSETAEPLSEMMRVAL